MSISYAVVFSGVFGSGTLFTFLSAVITVRSAFFSDAFAESSVFEESSVSVVLLSDPSEEDPSEEDVSLVSDSFFVSEEVEFDEEFSPKGTSSRFISGHGPLELDDLIDESLWLSP